jgi:hypothetical protein
MASERLIPVSTFETFPRQLDSITAFPGLGTQNAAAGMRNFRSVKGKRRVSAMQRPAENSA